MRKQRRKAVALILAVTLNRSCARPPHAKLEHVLVLDTAGSYLHT